MRPIQNSFWRGPVVSLGALVVLIAAHPCPAQCDATWTLRQATTPSGRYGGGMVYDTVRKVCVLFGGDNGSVPYFNETWTWDGAVWTELSPATRPPARYYCAMAFDTSRGVAVLFGGLDDNGQLNDTWEWDGVDWTDKTPASPTDSPEVRESPALAFDSNRGVTVLFGGYSGGSGTSETWEWDGVIWTKRSPATPPPARGAHAMAYDSGRGVCVVFGGNGPSSGPNGYEDTWEWDGTNWTEKMSVTHAPAQIYLAMSYESHRGMTVLHGVASTEPTWEWDGASWAERTSTVTPSSRSEHFFAFDADRHVTVMFSGSDNLLDTWEWSGPTPGITAQPVPQTVPPAQSVSFSVETTGSGLSFLWRKDGSPLSEDSRISGTTSATLTIDLAESGDAGDYDCVVTNACGARTSAAAALIVDPCKAADSTGDCNANTTLDSCEIATDPSLDSNTNGLLDACEAASAPCGLCGAGVSLLMPLSLLAFAFKRHCRRGTARRRHPAIISQPLQSSP